MGNKPQRYTQNRLSYTYTSEGVYTYFSYDPHGNVEWLVQNLPGLDKNYIRYEYDLLSNKVLAVHYNEGRADEFHHRYTYDDDQRIKTAETAWSNGRTLSGVEGSGVEGSGVEGSGAEGSGAGANVGWDIDATYTYYAHGPLKRLAIGEDNVQGIDYVYTINGWLKGINNVTPYTADDPGSDDNTTFSRDVFGMVLGYNSTDFNRTGSPYNPSDAQLVSSVSSTSGNPGVDLFNGNISSWTLRKDSAGSSVYNQLKGFKYRYDQLNRLKMEDYYDNTGSWSNSTMMDSRYTYDGNGNIDSLKRWGYNGSNVQMDNMKFNYYASTNRLDYVDDGISDGTFSTDADDQASNNYKFTPIGERAKDIKNGIDTIVWTVYGKVKYIKQTDGDSLAFTYDAAGNRVMKYWKEDGENPVVSYYVKDATGNDMALYERTTSGSNYFYKQIETPIYGSEMIGVLKPNTTTKTIATTGFCLNCDVNFLAVDLQKKQGKYTRALTKKEYFAKDHLSNIHTVFTDRKLTNGYADIQSYNNTYAYGMPLVGTNMNYNPAEVRYGMQNQERDDEIYNQTGAAYSAKFWIYDSRLGGNGRWDPDPVFKPWQSPYACFSGNPIWKIDPDGADDFFNSEGKLIKQTSSGSKIFVQTANGIVLFSQVQTNSMQNRQVLANITAQYAGQVGISGTVGVANYPVKGEKALAYTEGKAIYVNAKGGVSPLFDDYNNLKSALEHEKDHKEKNQGFTGASNFEHAEVYLNQVKGTVFDKTTSDFKSGTAGSIAKYLGDVAQEIGGSGGTGDFTVLDNLIGEFNKLSGKTGYTFNRVQTGKGYSNPELNTYKVEASPVKKSKK